MSAQLGGNMNNVVVSRWQVVVYYVRRWQNPRPQWPLKQNASNGPCPLASEWTDPLGVCCPGLRPQTPTAYLTFSQATWVLGDVMTWNVVFCTISCFKGDIYLQVNGQSFQLVSCGGISVFFNRTSIIVQIQDHFLLETLLTNWRAPKAHSMLKLEVPEAVR